MSAHINLDQISLLDFGFIANQWGEMADYVVDGDAGREGDALFELDLIRTVGLVVDASSLTKLSSR